MSDQVLQACVEAIHENLLYGKVVISRSADVFTITVQSGFDGSRRELHVEKPNLDDAVAHLARWVVERMVPSREPTQSVRKVRLLLNGSW